MLWDKLLWKDCLHTLRPLKIVECKVSGDCGQGKVWTWCSLLYKYSNKWKNTSRGIGKWERGENLLTQLILPFSRKKPKKITENSTPLSSPFLNHNPPKKCHPLIWEFGRLFLPLSPEYALIHKSGKIFHPLSQAGFNALMKTMKVW